MASQLSQVQTPLAIPRYPPFPEGLPAAPVEAVLSSQSELIAQLRGTLGYTPEEFDRWVAPILYRTAAFVHLLPASAHHHHRGAGGLWRHSLEVAFGAAQGSEGILLSLGVSPDRRRALESRWRLAACLAGLLHDAGKPFSDITVSDSTRQQVWSPYLGNLAEWTAQHQIERYFIQWPARSHKRHEPFALLGVHRLLTPETADYLAALGPEPLARLLETLTAHTVDQPLARLVQQADQSSVSLDLKRNGLGTAIEQYVLALIRRLLQSGRWSVNTTHAQVWHLREGAFLDWERGFADLLAAIRQDQVPGVPQDAERMADYLIERGIAQPFPMQRANKGRYWPVRLPASFRQAPTVRWMLRLTTPEWIFVADRPAPLEGAIIVEAAETTACSMDDVIPEEQHQTAQPASEALAPNQPPVVAPESISVNDPPADDDSDRAKEALFKMIEQYGAAASWLHTAIDPVLASSQPLGEIMDVLEGRVVMLHPAGTRRLGDPIEVMTALFEAGAIEPDFRYPDRKVRTMQGKKVLVFVEALSDAILSALKALDKEEVYPPPERSLATSDKAEAETFALETTEPATHSDGLIEASQVTIEQALGQLADMMRTGQGRWLVTPVVHQNGQSSTSARCLDRLASAYPGISLVSLRLALRNQDTLRFALDGDRLILKALPDARTL